MKIDRIVRRLFADESGATMTEYAVITALLVAVCLAMLIAIGVTSNSSLNTTTSNMQQYQTNSPP